MPGWHRPDPAIGSGALVVQVQRSPSFFPDIYNDDWFYMLDAKEGLQPAATIGKVFQRPYDPFRTPDRARAEELGDVLAEGIFWLGDQGRSMADADLGHWKDFLPRRKMFIERVLRMVGQAADVDPAARARMEAALKAARGRLALITPELCQEYLQAWASDRGRRWGGHIEKLPGPAIPGISARVARAGRPHAHDLPSCLRLRDPGPAWACLRV